MNQISAVVTAAMLATLGIVGLTTSVSALPGMSSGVSAPRDVIMVAHKYAHHARRHKQPTRRHRHM